MNGFDSLSLRRLSVTETTVTAKLAVRAANWILRTFAPEYAKFIGGSIEWRTLMDIPPEISDVHDNQGRTWEREGADWVTYASYTQRWSTAVTDLSGWGPFRPGRVDAWGGKTA